MINELRIGNLILNYRDEMVEVIGLVGDEIATSDNSGWNFQESFRPIPLSPDVLEKCGFVDEKINMSGCNIWHLGDWRIAKSFTREEGNFHLFHKRVSPPTWSLTEIKYLHQLQNLFWCLCGRELEINF